MTKSSATTKTVGFRCAPTTLDGEPELTSFSRIVQHYIRKYRPDAEEELSFFQQMRPLSKVIETAGMAINSENKRFPHQWRLKANALEEATTRLIDVIGRIRECRSFYSLFEIVQSTAGSVKGIGPLYVYDTALRIGAHLHLSPTEVYLHAGTRDGAKALGLNVRRESVPIGDLPREFRHLQAREIEDILCIYKKRFQ
jgi:hypothetical protein